MKMARGSCFAGKIKAGILGLAVLGAMALPAHAGDPPKLALSGAAWLTTDYPQHFQHQSEPGRAGRVRCDVRQSTATSGDRIPLSGRTSSSIGITPKWGPITFNFAGLAYTYPGADDIDYFEALGGATWTGGAWTLGLKDYWSPDNAQFFGNSNAIEGSVAYAFTNKLWNFFTPSVRGTVGFQSYEINADDYVYWNAGLTLGFLERWSADIRYYDTDYNSTQCFNQSGGRDNCDARAVGTIKATF
jgi:hypothetical protein